MCLRDFNIKTEMKFNKISVVWKPIKVIGNIGDGNLEMFHILE